MGAFEEAASALDLHLQWSHPTLLGSEKAICACLPLRRVKIFLVPSFPLLSESVAIGDVRIHPVATEARASACAILPLAIARVRGPVLVGPERVDPMSSKCSATSNIGGPKLGGLRSWFPGRPTPKPVAWSSWAREFLLVTSCLGSRNANS